MDVLKLTFLILNTSNVQRHAYAYTYTFPPYWTTGNTHTGTPLENAMALLTLLTLQGEPLRTK